MKTFIEHYCVVEGITESELIRRALSRYLDWNLTEEDNDPRPVKARARKTQAQQDARRQRIVSEIASIDEKRSAATILIQQRLGIAQGGST